MTRPRKATTLTALEYELYEEVTQYVREDMNRADLIGGKRKNTVGFALTVLQRWLASSPEAIYRSLVRRSARLERRKQEIRNRMYADFEPSGRSGLPGCRGLQRRRARHRVAVGHHPHQEVDLFEHCGR